MSAFCPHCGYDLEPAAAIVDGNWSWRPGFGLAFRDKLLPLTPHQHELAGTLMRARGAIVARSVIAERLGIDERDAYPNIISVQLSKMRQKLAPLGLDCPIINRWGRGLAWRSAAEMAVAA